MVTNATRVMSPEALKARRFRIKLRITKKKRRPMTIRVPCEYCGAWVECTEDDDLVYGPICEICTRTLASID